MSKTLKQLRILIERTRAKLPETIKEYGEDSYEVYQINARIHMLMWSRFPNSWAPPYKKIQNKA